MANHSSPAMRRYMRRFWPLMGGYVVLALLATRFLSAPDLLGGWRYGLAVLPALPLVGVIVAMGVYLVEETDEFLRSRMVEALLWALGAILVASTVWGFLEALAGAPQLPLQWLFPLFCAVMGVAELIGRWRYR